MPVSEFYSRLAFCRNRYGTAPGPGRPTRPPTRPDRTRWPPVGETLAGSLWSSERSFGGRTRRKGAMVAYCVAETKRGLPVGCQHSSGNSARNLRWPSPRLEHEPGWACKHKLSTTGSPRRPTAWLARGERVCGWNGRVSTLETNWNWFAPLKEAVERYKREGEQVIVGWMMSERVKGWVERCRGYWCLH